MILKGISGLFVKLLMYWYSNVRSAVLWNSVLGECFSVMCGVRQGGVLSRYLFAFYINDIINELKKSGYGIYIGAVFVGCILYADDIVLLYASCTGLQHMVNVCAQYGRMWDISFNPAKSQYITFGEGCPPSSRISLNNTELNCTEKLKYLGCYYHQRSCRIDLNNGICRFYAKFNNVLSVIGYNRNELATLHLVKTYCVPTVLYGCETWQLDCHDYRRLKVVWNNSIRRIFGCCWRESVSCILFYCNYF